MSFAEVLRELPSLTLEERQQLIRQAIGIDDPGISPADEELIEARLKAHRANPESALSAEEIKARLSSRFPE